MRTLAIVHNIAWVLQPNECHLVLDTQLPPLGLISTAFALAFSGDCLLLAHLAARGWDIPGGHCEAGETPEATMRREVYEETGARLGDVTVFGYQRIRILAPKPERYRYPYPETYQVFFRATAAALDPFEATEETVRRGLFPPTEARAILWVRDHREFYEVALGEAIAQGNEDGHNR